MNPAAGLGVALGNIGIDVLLHVGQEGNDVVARDFLDLIDLRLLKVGMVADPLGLVFGNADLAELRLGLAGQDLDLLPNGVLVLEGEDVSHLLHAEPMTFGMKFGSWAWELKRDLDRLEDARKNVAFGAISGAVGTYSSIEPFVEEYVCEHLGLVHDPLSTQVISRDHHAYLAGVLATTAATCERIATEVRNLQKTDTLEAEEPFRKGQKGSSAMPHKRNPITMEKVCGLSRVVKANAQVAFDNVALWHERDISHSSAERVAQADSFIALDHMFQCLIRVIDGLQLYPARMMANLNKTRGLIFSSKVLLALVDTGITREDAYAIVQENAMATWHEVQDCVSGPTFKERLEADPRCTVSQEKLDEIFDPWDFLTRIDTVFDRLEQLSFE